MANGSVGGLARQLRTAALCGDGGPGDGQLLEAFLSRRDEAAFAALVRRHGPLVLGVCRRVLRHGADAEDAFQATFLVLLRKAASIRRRELLANWLYGVAYRTALEARAARARRRSKERHVATRQRCEGPDEATRDLLPVLDEELSRLPDSYRRPIVLCDLQGRTRREAAHLLGWPEGTVAGRLARGRALLARRLARHGTGLAVGGLTTVLAADTMSAVVPVELAVRTVRAVTLTAAGQAAGIVSAEVHALVEGVVRTMLLKKLRIALLVVLAVGLLAPGATLLARRAGAEGTPKDQPDPAPAAAKPARAEPKDAPAPGYRWVFEPQAGRGLAWAIGRRDGKGVAAIEENDKDGALVLTLAHPAPTNRAGLVEFRPVAFDAQGKRHVLTLLCRVGTGEVGLNRFRLDPKELPQKAVKRLGVEMLTPEGVQLVARQAVARAKEEGVEVLPPARLGEKYDFVLTTLDGRKVRSADLKGKVVLLDCWSSH
jgi:RNA polymerase sigma factor (sigma-70 family)